MHMAFFAFDHMCTNTALIYSHVHITVLNCLLRMRQRAAAMRKRRPATAAQDITGTVSFPFPAPPDMTGDVCNKSCLPLFPGRVSAPSHLLDGRETAIAPAERARSAQRRSCGMQFTSRTRTTKPLARAKRATRLRCAASRA